MWFWFVTKEHDAFDKRAPEDGISGNYVSTYASDKIQGSAAFRNPQMQASEVLLDSQESKGGPFSTAVLVWPLLRFLISCTSRKDCVLAFA